MTEEQTRTISVSAKTFQRLVSIKYNHALSTYGAVIEQALDKSGLK